MANITDATNAYANIMKQATGAPDKNAGDDGGVSFGALLKTAAQGAIDAQHKSENTQAAAMVGKADMTEVLQSINNAEIALNTVLAIRDKVVQSYQEILRTPI